MNLISDEYQKTIRDLHMNDDDWGGNTSAYIFLVCAFIDKHRLYGKELLDYGCGKGTLRRTLGHHLNITNYDPAIPEFSKLPKVHKHTVCIDVLEHVEEEMLDSVLEHLAKSTRKSAYIVIDVVPALTTLPDGRNAHITLKTREEWIQVLSKYFDFIEIKTGLKSIRYEGESKYWKSRVINKSEPSKLWAKK